MKKFQAQSGAIVEFDDSVVDLVRPIIEREGLTEVQETKKNSKKDKKNESADEAATEQADTAESAE